MQRIATFFNFEKMIYYIEFIEKRYLKYSEFYL